MRHIYTHKTNKKKQMGQKYVVGQEKERLYMSATPLQFLSVHILWDSSMARWETFTKNGAHLVL